MCVYTSPVLDSDVDVIGVATARLHVESSAAGADFFVRLCDVDGAGVSRNVCDGLQRIAVDQSAGPQEVTVDLWPTAHRFRRGHRIRALVASGAFPRWARNLGLGEPLGTAATVRAAEQSVHHSATAPSCITLPVIAS